MGIPAFTPPRWKATDEGLIVPGELDHYIRSLRRWTDQVTDTLGTLDPSVIAALQADVLALQGDVATLQSDVAALPQGEIVSVVDNTIQGGINAIVDLTGLTSGAITPAAGRILLVTISTQIQSNTANARMDIILANAVNTVLDLRSAGAPFVNADQPISWSYRTVATGAAMTFKLRAQCGSGAGPVLSKIKGSLLVQDIGS